MKSFKDSVKERQPFQFDMSRVERNGGLIGDKPIFSDTIAKLGRPIVKIVQN